MLKYGSDCPFVRKSLSLEKYIQWLCNSNRITSLVQEALDRAVEKYSSHVPITYIAGALTGISNDLKERYVIASSVCEQYGMFGYAPHLFGTDPIKHPDVTPDEVRDIDFLWSVVMPDFHINFPTPPATGPGIEEGWAEIF